MPTFLILLVLLGQPAAPAAPDLTITEVGSGCSVYSGSALGYGRIDLHGIYRFECRGGCAYHAKYVKDDLRAVLVGCTDSEALAYWGPVSPIAPAVPHLTRIVFLTILAAGLIVGVVKACWSRGPRPATPADHPPGSRGPRVK